MTLTPEQAMAAHKTAAERANGKTNLPATQTGTAVAVTYGNKTAAEQYVDDISSATIVGRMAKFTKEGKFITTDDEETIGDEVDFITLVDQTLIGWMKFNGEGQPPDRVMGLLYDGFAMPPRESLGDNDVAAWELGLNGKPQDPWQHHVYLVLQRADTSEMFTFVTSSITGRRAIGNLLRHYNRTQKTNPDAYPLVRLKVGGFQHRDERVGWVKVPVLAIVGSVPKAGTAKPDSSHAADMNDAIPF